MNRGALYLTLLAFACSACTPAVMYSPGSDVGASLSSDRGVLRYSVSFHGQEVIAPSELGIVLSGDTIGRNASIVRTSSSEINEEFPSRGIHSTAHNHCMEYEYAVRDGQYDFRLQMRLFDDGIAFRYLFDGTDSLRVNAELTSFRVPSQTPVWFFERTSDWKMKTYAGEWMRTMSDSLFCISPEGPVQGAVLLYELPESRYMALTEAALFDYSGMRYRAQSDASLKADFTEGAEGFMVAGTFSTPWRVIMLADDLNELVNCDIVSGLAPGPDSTLFADTDWIKPGRVVWSWWSDCRGYLTVPYEKHFVDAAQELGYEYTLLDEGWEDWKDKWNVLKDICGYAGERGVKVWVWKHADAIKNPEGDYPVMAAFLDSVRNAGACGVKIDFMNGETKALVDFDIRALQMCAGRRLMVDFHGCQKPSGESRTYPNELTREGIRGLELNRMNMPLPSSHNVALVFTRCILGNADYTPIGFTRPGSTTYAHQLATAFAFTSPMTVVGEHVDTLLGSPRVAPMLPLIKALPTAWDETRILPGSSVGSLALMARRCGDDWYLVALNADGEKDLSVPADFLGDGIWNSYSISDDGQDPTRVCKSEGQIDKSASINLHIASDGGYVAMFKRK